MVCSNTTAPIDIVTAKNVPCVKKCNFIYDFGNSSCSVTNMGHYLDIMCFDGQNELNYSGVGALNVVKVKLYPKGLNAYDGKKMDAELIIECSGMVGGGTFFICIPIKASDEKSYSNTWFSQFIGLSPSSRSSGKQVMRVSNFSMNDIIPRGAFYYYEGTFPWSCNTKDKMIIFDKNFAININNDDYKTITNILQSKQYTLKQGINLVYNKEGTKNNRSGGDSGLINKGITCVPITDENGNPLVDEKKKNVSSKKSNMLESIVAAIISIPPWLKTVLLVILGLIVAFFLFWIIKKIRIFVKNKKSTSGTSTSILPKSKKLGRKPFKFK